MAKDLAALTQAQYDAWNAHDVEAVVATFAPDAVLLETTGAEHRGAEAIGASTAGWIQAFPDIHFDVTRVVAQDDVTVAEWTATGTNDGELMGMPATGRPSTTRGVTVARFDGEGRVGEQRTYFDTLAILQNLGHLPAPEAAQP